MQKSLIALAVVIPLAALGGFAFAALPAMAESGEDDSCIVAPALDALGPLDLEAIPTKPVSGALSVQGAGLDCDEDDEDEGREHGSRHESGSEDDD